MTLESIKLKTHISVRSLNGYKVSIKELNQFEFSKIKKLCIYIFNSIWLLKYIYKIIKQLIKGAAKLNVIIYFIY